jgi:DNA-binding NarL/FixJ family response regulator
MLLVGTATDGEKVLDKVRELYPDVLIYGLGLPNLDGLAVIRAASRGAIRPRIVVCAETARRQHVQAAMRAGARAFLFKDAPPEHLVKAIRAVHRGATVPPLATARPLGPGGGRAATAPATVEALNPREIEVLRLLARGTSNQQIAALLVLNHRTVIAHVRVIFDKLRVADRTEAAIYAREHGLA